MKNIYLIASLIILLQACSKSSGPKNAPVDCATVAKSFSADVNPIIQTYCNVPSCHASGSVNGPGPLTNHTQVFNARFQIRAAIQSGLMPQNATLTSSQRNSIICWIDAGAGNN